MNGWNDFQYNMAAGAGTCGVCYWLRARLQQHDVAGHEVGVLRLHAEQHRPRRDDAAQVVRRQLLHVGDDVVPDGQRDRGLPRAWCARNGRSLPDPASHPQSPRARSVNPPADGSPSKTPPTTIPASTGRRPLRHAVRWPWSRPPRDCSSTPPRCSAGNLAACMVTVLDQLHDVVQLGGLQLRGDLAAPAVVPLSNSVITDVQQAGLTMVTGGGYSASDVVPGHWALVRKSVFIGHTQENNPLASNGGPFNPSRGCAATRTAGAIALETTVFRSPRAYRPRSAISACTSACSASTTAPPSRTRTPTSTSRP